MRLQPVLLAALVALPGAAMADVPDSEIVRCATMMDDTARLACYDAIAASRSAEAVAAAEKRKAAAAERAEREAKEKAERQQQAFGAESIPELRSGSDAAEEVDAIKASAMEVFRDGLNRFVVVLDNGQIWRQTDDRRMLIRKDDSIEIERSPISGYRMKVGDRSGGIHVARVK